MGCIPGATTVSGGELVFASIESVLVETAGRQTRPSLSGFGGLLTPSVGCLGG